jgi:hypothetical protein
MSFPITFFLPILVIAIVVALTIWAAHAVFQNWRERKRFARFKGEMIAAFRIPRLFGYDEGQCLVCRGRVDRDQSQAQLVWTGRNKLRILSASDSSEAEIFLPPQNETQIAHLSCVSGKIARQFDGGKRLFSMMDAGSSRYVALHDDETEKYFCGFFPKGWRPGDNYTALPFSITQPEILVEYLLARARKG